MSLSFLKSSTLAAVASLTLAACSHIATFTGTSGAQITEKVTVHAVSAQGIGQAIGTIEFKDSAAGLVMMTQLSQLPSGPHGFHIHEKGSCDPAVKDGKMGAALAAGGHFNPMHTQHHGTPLNGHLGDLPLLNVDAQGKANLTLISPRLTLADIHGLAVMIHSGGDNYADQPKPLGGGGERIACGVIQ